MKKNAKWIIFFSITAIFLLGGVLGIALAPKGSTDSSRFWIAWTFAFPVSFTAAACIHLLYASKEDSALVRIPVAYAIVIIGSVAYFAIFFLFTFNPFIRWMDKKINGTTLLVSIEVVITVIYAIASALLLFGANYIIKTRAHTKRKVLYIRMLQADVEDCIPKTQNAALREALTAFAEKIHYSDPMSDAALAGIEGELSSTVAKISTALISGADEEALQLISLGEELLSQRNRRCIMLK